MKVVLYEQDRAVAVRLLHEQARARGELQVQTWRPSVLVVWLDVLVLVVAGFQE